MRRKGRDYHKDLISFQKMSIHEIINRETPIKDITMETTRLLFHQRLGHSSADFIANEIPIKTIRAETQQLLYHQRLAHASDELTNI